MTRSLSARSGLGRAENHESYVIFGKNGATIDISFHDGRIYILRNAEVAPGELLNSLDNLCRVRFPSH